MKKIKYYALGLLGIAMLTLGLYACSNEDASNPQKEVAQTKLNDFEGGVIAEIKDGKAVPLYDEVKLKEALVTKGFFTSVESIELVYGFNPDERKEEAFITYIGTEVTTSATVAVIIDLVIDGDELIIPNPENNQKSFSKHSCNGFNCRSCAFTRSGFFRRITGCTPCQAIIEEGKSAGCVHSINGGGVAVEIAKASLDLIKP